MNSPFQLATDASPGELLENRTLRRLIGWVSVLLLAIALAGVNIVLPSLSNELNRSLLGGLLLGVCIAEVNLIALWGVMAPGRWILRLPWSLALLTLMWYTLAIGARWGSPRFEMEEAIHLGETLLLGYAAAMLPLTIIAAIFKWRLERPEDQEVREQMSVGLLLIVMTLLAVLLALGKVVLPQSGFRISLMEGEIFILLGAIVLFNLLQTTPAIWISFLPPRVAFASSLGMILYAIGLSVVEILFIAIFLGMPPNFWKYVVVFSGMNVGQTATVILVLASMRILEFQLVRKTAENPFANPTVAASLPHAGQSTASEPRVTTQAVDQTIDITGKGDRVDVDSDESPFADS